MWAMEMGSVVLPTMVWEELSIMWLERCGMQMGQGTLMTRRQRPMTSERRFLKNMRSESLLDVLATQGFSKERSMVLMSENALPGIDGRWTSSKHAGVKTIQGKTLYWGFGMQFGINYLPMERLSYDHMGMARTCLD
eukprot:g2332.t1